MKIIFLALIIGLVGGMLDVCTSLHKVWCFLLGVAAFFVFVLIQSAIKAIVIMRRTKGSKKICLDQNNNIIKTE